jgi:beta-galactosidase GanA
VVAGLAAIAATVAAQDLPAVRVVNGASQLLVQGKPFLVLGGELGNSAAGTAAQADAILPGLARLHFNTVLMPVAWGEIEPGEGRFDFSVPDHWMDVAREQHLHLVFLWFGSWKNAFSEYAPAWVLTDTKRFPREISADGAPLEILSPLGDETARCDSRAFAALMRHVHDRDAARQTVLMVQVENEIGFLGVGGRDRSETANRLFEQPIPAELSRSLDRQTGQMGELAVHFQAGGGTWREVFGDAANEAFMAWQYGRFVNQVAQAGKAAYGLPMYMNAQLPAALERAGEYPSGGPYPELQTIYRAAAPAIDFYAPDIYWPDFGGWVSRYRIMGNPVFVPEARLDAAAANALYLFGEARGFGFSPFAVDSLEADSPAGAKTPQIAQVYEALGGLSDSLMEAEEKGQTRGLVLHATSPRPSQTVTLGGFLMRATLSRSWPSQQLAASDGGMLAIENGPGDFLVAGSGLTVTFVRDPDVDDQMAGIAQVEQVTWRDGQWATERELNGDQTDQGRALQMDPETVRVYRVRLYAHPRQQGQR